MYSPNILCLLCVYQVFRLYDLLTYSVNINKSVKYILFFIDCVEILL